MSRSNDVCVASRDSDSENIFPKCLSGKHITPIPLGNLGSSSGSIIFFSDAVIPTKPTPADLAGMRLYDEEEIIKLLHIAAKKAKERLDADDSELLGN
ncbi:hypothetical protein [Photorhabdus temperata]|uniref:hypothetical protein n=1 Tax=Photorhabdus temperata TaxID=574560 RepID=UPI000389F24A|nr:hypothetical protein [Photorhabdus temperata]EQC00555.1 hypothetical protein B738_10501 [Photorhabdus temperata subsp. temperata M1021]